MTSTFPLNFQRQFAPAVLAGDKRMTIRATRKDRKVPKVGDMLALYTGLRTRNVQLLLRAPVTCVWRVRIDFDDRYIVIDGLRLDRKAANLLAVADGFEGADPMFEYFREKGLEAERFTGEFEGFAVHWNPKAGRADG